MRFIKKNRIAIRDLGNNMIKIHYEDSLILKVCFIYIDQ